MGLLHQLWDDTVAGPPPLGKLRKYNSFSPSSSNAVQVTRTVTIARTPSSCSSTASSPRSPSSPPSAPDSPVSPSGRWGDWKRLRNKTAAVGMETASPRVPTVYDWVVISSLDR